MPSCLNPPLQLVSGYDDDEESSSLSDTKDGVYPDALSETPAEKGSDLDRNAQLIKVSSTLKAPNTASQQKWLASYLHERKIPQKPSFFSLTAEEDAAERESALRNSRSSLGIPFLDHLPCPREELAPASKARFFSSNNDCSAKKELSPPLDAGEHSKTLPLASSEHRVLGETDPACSSDTADELLSLFQVAEQDQNTGTSITESPDTRDVFQSPSGLSLGLLDQPLPQPLPSSDLSLQASATVAPSLWSQEAVVKERAIHSGLAAETTTECGISDNQLSSSLIAPPADFKSKRRREDPFFFPHVPPEKTVCISSQDLRNPNWMDHFKRGDGRLKKNGSLALSGLQLKPALEPSRRQRQKNQINYLAQEASNKEHEYWERSAQQRMSKYQTQMKYGW